MLDVEPRGRGIAITLDFSTIMCLAGDIGCRQRILADNPIGTFASRPFATMHCSAKLQPKLPKQLGTFFIVPSALISADVFAKVLISRKTVLRGAIRCKAARTGPSLWRAPLNDKKLTIKSSLLS